MKGKLKWKIAGSLAIALVGSYLYVGVDLAPHMEYSATDGQVMEDTIPAPPSAYGIPLDGFEVERDKVASGSTFSDMMAGHGISASVIDSLVRLSAPVFNIGLMRAGHPVAFIFTADEARLPAYFVYEADQVDHVVFDLRQLAVRVEKRPIDVVEKSMSVVVTGALWNDLMNAGADPALAAELSDVFAWTVDFYRIQKGDRFTMIYREQTVDGEPYGQPKLLGARYEGSVTQEAYRYEQQDGQVCYYDAQGNSLRKAFLQAPLKYSRISSGFTKKRFHPVQKRWKAHLGTDYAAPYGTPIMSVGDGVVERAGYTAGNGNYVKIRHNGTYETQYLHMRKILVRNGQVVKQGQTIGEVGSTGLATGPHVCFRFWKNGQQVDPRKQEMPRSEPLAKSQRPQFLAMQEVLFTRMNEAESATGHVGVASF